jgi:ribose transport system substrate-binding protein
MAAMAALSACGGGRHETTEIYVLVAANKKIPYWQEAAEGLRSAAHDLEVKYDVVGPDTYDPQAEKAELLGLIHRQIPPAGILVSAADPELMREAIDAAAAAGIPVITIDADSPKSKRLTFIGTNNFQAGQMSGDLLAKQLNGKGNVIFFSMAGQENLDERVEGCKRVLAKNPGIKVVQTINIGGDPAKAFDGTKAAIANPSAIPDAFVCFESLSCSEVADVLDRAGIKGKTVIAMDTQEGTLNWMRKGMIRATIAQKPYTMAYFGARVLDDFHHAKPTGDVAGTRSPVPAFMDTGATLVDKTNMASFAPPAESK